MTELDLESPVIVTGRGGSGTRLITPMLETMGVFMGKNMNISGDGMEWVDLTRAMLMENVVLQGGSLSDSWRNKLTQNAEGILSRVQHEKHSLWGWKLPEMMHLSDQFLDVFPAAKIIHITRHPVTLSIRRTHLSSRMNNDVGRIILPRAYAFLGLDPQGIGKNPKYINNAISWEFQVRSFAESASIRNLPPHQYLTIRYEDLVFNQALALDQVSHFLALKAPRVGYTSSIDKNRVRRFSDDDPRIQKVWSICGNTASALGYTDAFEGIYGLNPRPYSG